MSKQFKSVAHLYLGVTVQTSIRRASRKGEPMYKCKGILESVSIYYRDMDLAEVHLEDEPYPSDNVHLAWGSIKPILRRLESMTEEEMMAYENMSGMILSRPIEKAKWWTADAFVWACSLGFDLFGLIDSNQAIDAATLPA